MTVVEIDRPAFEQSVRRVTAALQAQPKRVYTALRPAMRDWGLAWQKRVRARLEGSPLRSRTGALKQSLHTSLRGTDLGSLTLRMESLGNLAYARIQETGGEITPKRGKFLTIPTEFNKKPSGATDFPSARALIATHPDDTFFLPYRNASGEALLLMWRKAAPRVVRRTKKISDRRAGGAQDGAVPMFRLVKKVDLPGPRSPSKKGPSRLGFFDSWTEGRAERAARLVEIGKRLARDFGGGS